MNKKHIKIKFTDFGSYNKEGVKWDPANNIITEMLRKHYDVQLSEDPDYVFFSNYGADFLSHDGIRIYVAREFISPDFTLADYAIGMHNLQFEDRYIKPPSFYLIWYPYPKNTILSRSNFTMKELERKEYFAAFIHSSETGPVRNAFFDKVNKYKKVISGGRFRNNIGYFINDKGKLISKSKFYFAMENTEDSDSHRLSEAFYHKAMAIYWGDKSVSKMFNTKAFVNCHEFDNFDDVLEQIKKIDANDDLYISMMRQPVLADGFTFQQAEKELECFLCNIVDQDYEKARRRSRTHYAIIHAEIYKEGLKYYTQKKYISSVFKRYFLTVLEKLFLKIGKARRRINSFNKKQDAF
jgi:hypothetical protein